MKIYTSNFDDYRGTRGFSITRNPIFDPAERIWQIQYDQQSALSENDKLRFFVEQYYEAVLKYIQPETLLAQLKEGSVLLSNENPKYFGIRQIVAIWLELYYGLEVREVKSSEDGTLKTLPRNKYYSSIKEMLEILIKQDIDMHGYTAICAAHAYEQAKKIADNEELCNTLGISEEVYLRLADSLEKNFGSRQKKDSA